MQYDQWSLNMDISNALVKNFDFFYEELIEALNNDQAVSYANDTKLKLISSNEIKIDYDSAENSLAIYKGNKNTQQVELPLGTLESMDRHEATRLVGEAMLQLVPELREKIFAQAS